MLCINVCPYSYLSLYGYSCKSLAVTFYRIWVLSKSNKNYCKDKCLLYFQPNFLILPYLLAQQNSYNTEIMNNCMKVWSNWIKVWSHITEKLSFTNIEGLCINFVYNKSFIGTYFSDILSLCETNFDNLIDSGNFSVKPYLHLIWRYSAIHIHGPEDCFVISNLDRIL